MFLDIVSVLFKVKKIRHTVHNTEAVGCRYTYTSTHQTTVHSTVVAGYEQHAWCVKATSIFSAFI